MKIKKRYVISILRNNKLEYLHFNNTKVFNMYTYVLDKEQIPYVSYEECFYEEY